MKMLLSNILLLCVCMLHATYFRSGACFIQTNLCACALLVSCEHARRINAVSFVRLAPEHFPAL